MPESVGVIVAGGVATDVAPEAAIIIIALGSLIDELNKKEPFGPNNDLIKALKNIQNDLAHGPGPNNDVVKILNNGWNDLTQGLGPNNDIRKALENLGIRF